MNLKKVHHNLIHRRQFKLKVRFLCVLERIYNNVWTEEINRFLAETVNAIVSVKLNSEFVCTEAFDLFLSDNSLLNAAKSSEKYEK
jgi:hypothetical protein